MTWIDDFLTDEPITETQIGIIESLLTRVPYSLGQLKQIEDGMLRLTEQQAFKLIGRLKEDEIPNDPREQFKRFNF